ncbi:TPA: hypothetical protein DEB72_03435 [Patescibacteria group bacterium]|nr:hypothetical protein [Patescibacteria group bacterium]
MANHRRIDIMRFVRRADGATLQQISDGLKCNFKTISEHTRRLVQAGLLNKKYQGQRVLHSLSPYGKRFLTFSQTF